MSYNPNKDFTTLVAWLKAREVRRFFYQEVIPRLPKDEQFNLNLQIRKACVSGTANIAEGYGRYHYREATQFCRISRGSLSELKDHLITSFEEGYANHDAFSRGEQLIEDAKIAISGYIKYLEAKTKSESKN